MPTIRHVKLADAEASLALHAIDARIAALREHLARLTNVDARNLWQSAIEEHEAVRAKLREHLGLQPRQVKPPKRRTT